MTRQQAFDAAWKTLIGLMVIAAWGWGGKAVGWVNELRAIVKAWPEYVEMVDALDLDMND